MDKKKIITDDGHRHGLQWRAHGLQWRLTSLVLVVGGEPPLQHAHAQSADLSIRFEICPASCDAIKPQKKVQKVGDTTRNCAIPPKRCVSQTHDPAFSTPPFGILWAVGANKEWKGRIGCGPRGRNRHGKTAWPTTPCDWLPIGSFV